MVPETARRLFGAVGERIGRDVRNRDPRRVVCSCDCIDPAARCTPAGSTTRFRPSVRDHLAPGAHADARLDAPAQLFDSARPPRALRVERWRGCSDSGTGVWAVGTTCLPLLQKFLMAGDFRSGISSPPVHVNRQARRGRNWRPHPRRSEIVSRPMSSADSGPSPLRRRRLSALATELGSRRVECLHW